MNFKGVWPATISPFVVGGELDLAAYERLLFRLAGEGVAGFVPCATTGEGPTLSDGERRELLEASVRVAKQKGLRVIAGCNSNDTKKVVQLTQEAATLGCDAALVVTPYYNRPTQAGLIAHYREVALRSPLPIILYNVPGRTAVNLLPETVDILFSEKNIVGIKEASGNYSQWLSLTAKESASGKTVLSGDDDALAPILALGGVGIISASANVTAIPFVQICEMMGKGDFQGAFGLQKKLLPLVKAMFQETSPAPIKCALKRLGQAEATVRLPLVTVGEETRKNVEAVLRQLELI